MAHRGTNIERSPYYGALQAIVDSLFADEDPVAEILGETALEVRRLDVVLAAEASDLPDDLREIVSLLPPGIYTRRRLVDQLNSSINGHAWGQVYGTVA